MKKTLLFILALLCNIVLGCYGHEHKTEAENPTVYDAIGQDESENIPDTAGKVGFPK